MAASIQDSDEIDDLDNPELTEADFARSQPFSEAHPAIFDAWKRGRGRPTVADRAKVRIGFRLDADLVDAVRAAGKGYTARVEQALRAAIKNGTF